MPKVISTLAAAAALAAVCLLACGEDEIPPPRAPVVNDTPANCLRVIAGAWGEKDYARLQLCLSNNLVFYFNPDDAGEQAVNDPRYIIPLYWRYVQTTEAITNMFNHAYAADLEITTSSVGTPGPQDQTWRANNVVTTAMFMPDRAHTFRTAAGHCNYEFERYEDDGQTRWRITKWCDFTESGHNEWVSLGQILVYYK